MQKYKYLPKKKKNKRFPNIVFPVLAQYTHTNEQFCMHECICEVYFQTNAHVFICMWKKFEFFIGLTKRIFVLFFIIPLMKNHN